MENNKTVQITLEQYNGIGRRAYNGKDYYPVAALNTLLNEFTRGAEVASATPHEIVVVRKDVTSSNVVWTSTMTFRSKEGGLKLIHQELEARKQVQSLREAARGLRLTLGRIV